MEIPPVCARGSLLLGPSQWGHTSTFPACHVGRSPSPKVPAFGGGARTTASQGKQQVTGSQAMPSPSLAQALCLPVVHPRQVQTELKSPELPVFSTTYRSSLDLMSSWCEAVITLISSGIAFHPSANFVSTVTRLRGACACVPAGEVWSSHSEER